MEGREVGGCLGAPLPELSDFYNFSIKITHYYAYFLIKNNVFFYYFVFFTIFFNFSIKITRFHAYFGQNSYI